MLCPLISTPKQTAPCLKEQCAFYNMGACDYREISVQMEHISCCLLSIKDSLKILANHTPT